MSPSFAWCLFHVWEVEESKNILSPGSALSLTGRGPFSAHPRVSLDFEGYEKYNNAVWFVSFFFSDGSWCICILLSPGIHLFVNHSNNWSQSSSQLCRPLLWWLSSTALWTRLSTWSDPTNFNVVSREFSNFPRSHATLLSTQSPFTLVGTDEIYQRLWYTMTRHLS